MSLLTFIRLVFIALCAGAIYVMQRYKQKTVKDGTVVYWLLTGMQILCGLAALAAFMDLSH